ncbi:hypothetical protein IE53DRAFT_374836 [Violaceomyces palustris]|uniref:Uncharacterized protein n=1 Tax=Violaceomyces palustris TaxID=1673888 RepID=A0ACD0NW57_9BASI|nr:hypothetical protein IE53DRAFT_374836 [Violaceomyces palustris]
MVGEVPPAMSFDYQHQHGHVTLSNASASSSGSSGGPSKSRPARKQISEAKLQAIRASADKSNQQGLTYNIWYNKWSGGDREDDFASKVKSQTRCEVARDSGYTRADLNSRKAGLAKGEGEGEVGDGAYCCLYFARGCCPLGSDCTYLHRLPRPTAIPEQGRDVFGREKHGDYRDDMGGVGSMQRVNRTLYIGRIHEEPSTSNGGAANFSTNGAQWRDGGRTLKGGRSASDLRREKAGGFNKRHEQSSTEKVIRRHFSEWGEIERVKVLQGRSCAFVTYKSEANAQFAKEAMSNQSLDHNEVLNVRWATDDPNPGAQKRNLREMREQGERVMLANMTPEMLEAQDAILSLEDLEQAGGTLDTNAKRRRMRTEETMRYEEEMKRLDEENLRNWEEMAREKEEREREKEQEQERAAKALPEAKGLLDDDAMGGLQYLSALRKRQEQERIDKVGKEGVAETAVGLATGLGSLAAYGSDSEEEGEEGGDDDDER